MQSPVVKEGPETLLQGRKSYLDLPNHQQNVYSLDDVIQKDFFSVDFHGEKFKTGVKDFIAGYATKKSVSAGAEFNKKGEMLLNTWCTACHSNIQSVKNSFIDVQLYKKVPVADLPVHLSYQNLVVELRRR